MRLTERPQSVPKCLFYTWCYLWFQWKRHKFHRNNCNVVQVWYNVSYQSMYPPLYNHWDPCPCPVLYLVSDLTNTYLLTEHDWQEPQPPTVFQRLTQFFMFNKRTKWCWKWHYCFMHASLSVCCGSTYCSHFSTNRSFLQESSTGQVCSPGHDMQYQDPLLMSLIWVNHYITEIGKECQNIQNNMVQLKTI